MISLSPSPSPDPAPPGADRPTDAQVMARSIVEPSAFTAIFDRHHDAIHRYLLRRLPAAVADDLASETFLRAFDSRTRFDATRADSARPWLFGIAVNLARRHRRDERRGSRALSRHGVSRDNSAGDLDAVHGRLDAAAYADVLEAAVRNLSDRLRDPLLLHVWGELTYAEVAVALDLPIGTVRSRIARARDGLRSALPTEDLS